MAENQKVDAQVVDALTIGNVKTIGEAASFAMASLFQHQVNHARRVDALSEAHLGKVLNTFSSIDATEAVATAKLFKGEADSGVMSLLTQLAGGQIGAKVAQSTPGDLSLELNKLQSSIASLQGQNALITATLERLLNRGEKAAA